MKFILTTIFTFSLIASAANAASLICEGEGGLQAQFRINKNTLTVLYYGNSNFGDYPMTARTPWELTFTKKPHNSNNGIPTLIVIPATLINGKEGTKANVKVIVTPYNTRAGVTCTVSRPGRQY